MPPCLPAQPSSLCVFTTVRIAAGSFCQDALKICLSSGIITDSWREPRLDDRLFCRAEYDDSDDYFFLGF